MTIKLFHISTVFISFLFFTTRFYWMIAKPSLLKAPWVKIFPHVVDSLLLISAIVLTIQISQYPFVDAWLTSKVLALLAYIIIGNIALKRGKSKPIRIVAGIISILIFLFMISVATTKDALGFLSLM